MHLLAQTVLAHTGSPAAHLAALTMYTGHSSSRLRRLSLEYELACRPPILTDWARKASSLGLLQV